MEKQSEKYIEYIRILICLDTLGVEIQSEKNIENIQ